MFRQRLHEQQENGDWFVSRVCELPVVNSAFGQLTSLYTGVKSHNRLLRFTLETAEGGVNVVVDRARPVVAKFDKPIGALNTIACQQLDKLEHDYPIIMKPTDVVIKETKQLCDNAVKPIVERVSAVKQYGVDKVVGVKTYTTDKIYGVKEYSLNTLSSVGEIGVKQAERVMETTICRQVVTGLDAALDIADKYVDAYLPEAESDRASEAAAPSEQKQVMCKARSIGNKVRRRMYARLAGQLRTVQLRSQETIANLNFTVDLIEYSRGTVNCAKDKALYIWTEVNKSEEDVMRELSDSDAETRLHSDSTFERKALATARHLTQKTKHAMASVGLPLDALPGMISGRLQPIRNLSLQLRIPNSADLYALNNYVLHILGDYQRLMHDRFSQTFRLVVNLEPVKTMAPGLSKYVVSTTDADFELKRIDELDSGDEQQQQQQHLQQEFLVSSCSQSGSDADEHQQHEDEGGHSD